MKKDRYQEYGNYANLDISQGILIKKFEKYLRLQDRDQETIRQVMTTKGLCFGLSVCLAAMNCLGKGELWLDLLRKVANWNEEVGSLKEVAPIFERVINDVISYHYQLEGICNKNVDSFDFFAPSQFIEKLKLLQPNSFFQINVDGKIRKIEDSLFLAHRKYTSSELEAVINESRVKGNMCVVVGKAKGGGHACEISFREGKWSFYDPGEGEKACDNKGELLSEVFGSIGCELQISFASFEKNAFANDSDKTKLYCKNLQSSHHFSGLHMVLAVAPEQFDCLLELVENSEIRAIIVEALSLKSGEPGLVAVAKLAPKRLGVLLKLAEKYQDIRVAITEALLKRDNRFLNATIALKTIAKNAPLQLEILLEMSKRYDDIKATIIKGLPMQQENTGVTTLETIAESCPKQFNYLLEQAETDIGIWNAVIKALLTEDGKKMTGLHKIVKVAPEPLDKILQLAETHKDIRVVIAEALLIQHKDSGITIIETMAETAPKQFGHLLDLADSYEEIRDAIAAILPKRHKGEKYGKTVLKKIEESAPEQFKLLLKLGEEHKALRIVIVKTMLMRTSCYCETTIDRLAKNSPEQFTYLLELATADKEVLALVVNALLKKDGWNATALHSIAKKAPEQLDKIFELAKLHKEIRDAIVKALPIQHRNDCLTIIETMAETAPKQFGHLLDLADSDEEIRDAIAAILPKRHKGEEYGKTVLKKIEESAPEQFKLLLKLGEEHKALRIVIVKTMLMRTSCYCETTIDRLAKNSPEQFTYLLKLATTDKEVFDLIVAALRVQDRRNVTALHRIALFSSEHLNILFAPAKQNEKIKAVIEKIKIEIKKEISSSSLVFKKPKEIVRFVMFLYKHLKFESKDIKQLVEGYGSEVIKQHLNHLKSRASSSHTSTFYKPNDNKLDSDEEQLVATLKLVLAEESNSGTCAMRILKHV